MRLLSLIALSSGLSFAHPIENVKPSPEAPAAPAAHPAVATYNYVSTQLATVITEIRLFDVRNPRTDALYRHGMETLETLKKANEEVFTGPEFDFWTTTSFLPALASLNWQIHQMRDALTEKKPEIETARVELVFYTLLKQCVDASSQMRSAVHGKMPKWISNMTKPMINEAIKTVEGARDLFKPSSGDVDVVVVSGDPNADPAPYTSPSAPLPNPIPDNNIPYTPVAGPLPNPIQDNRLPPRPVAQPVAQQVVPKYPQVDNGLTLIKKCKLEDDD